MCNLREYQYAFLIMQNTPGKITTSMKMYYQKFKLTQL